MPQDRCQRPGASHPGPRAGTCDSSGECRGAILSRVRDIRIVRKITRFPLAALRHVGAQRQARRAIRPRRRRGRAQAPDPLGFGRCVARGLLGYEKTRIAARRRARWAMKQQ